MKKSPASSLGHDLDTLDNARNDLVFDGAVEIFGQLANHEKIHLLMPGRQATEIAERAHRREQAKLAGTGH